MGADQTDRRPHNLCPGRCSSLARSRTDKTLPSLDRGQNRRVSRQIPATDQIGQVPPALGPSLIDNLIELSPAYFVYNISWRKLTRLDIGKRYIIRGEILWDLSVSLSRAIGQDQVCHRATIDSTSRRTRRMSNDLPSSSSNPGTRTILMMLACSSRRKAPRPPSLKKSPPKSHCPISKRC